MKRILPAAALALLALCLGPNARADLKVKQRTTVGGQASEGTVMIKGARQRSETGGEGASQLNIMQCDLRRTLLVNDNTRRYFVSPFDQANATTDAAETNAATPAATTRRGGTVTYTTTIIDTGERRQMFGLTARHLKTTFVGEPAPDACEQTRFRLETDGWYTDFTYGLSCATSAVAMSTGPSQSNGCQDRVVNKQVGTARLGFPLAATTRYFGPDGQVTFTSTTEVLELTSAPLASALFDVPAGYTEARSTQELYGLSVDDAAGTLPGGGQPEQPTQAATATPPATPAPGSKRAGTIRIGVAQVKDLTDKGLALEAARAQLLRSLTTGNVEAVPLNAYTPAALDAEAKEKECDFFLTTDIISLKLSAARKLGGLLSRATGTGPAGVDRTEAQVKFKLTAVGSVSPQLQAAANAKAEGDDASLNAALSKEAQAVVNEARKKQ